jgi:twinkle protein
MTLWVVLVSYHMIDEEGTFLRHEPCPMCGSRDNLGRYTDHAYCFGCGYYESSQTESSVQPQRRRMSLAIEGEFRSVPSRKISEEVAKKYRCSWDGKVIRYYYVDGSGAITGAKVRTRDKQFHWEGECCHRLYGQNLFPDKGKRVVITEGEYDAMSCAEAMPGWPMVSLPTGSTSAKKSVQKQLEWLQGYEEIVLFFDNDEPGQHAATEAAGVLPPGKVRIATLNHKYKDASDALVAGDADAIRRAIWDAKTFRPDGIVEGKTLLSTLTAVDETCLHEYPFRGLQAKLHGIRPRELVTITAGSGIGKSSLCRDLAAGLLASGESVGYLALEESTRRTALGLMSAAVGQSLHMEASVEEITNAYNRTIADWKLFLFDGFGSYDPDVIYNRIEYLAAGLEVKIVFLDHLSILLSGLDGDERRTIDITMTRLRSLVERTGITLFLVCHVSGDDNGKPYEEGGRVKLNKLRGSRSIGQLSDAVIALERDQQATKDGDVSVVRVLKNRYSGEVGPACKLKYNLSTCQYAETEYEAEPQREEADHGDF